MKRAQVAALVAGAALGLAGVAAYVLRREENREAAIKLAKTSAEQALKLGNEVARQAVEQYQAQAPRAIETLSGVLPQLAARMAPAAEPVSVEA
jgi:predicted kinase